MREFANLLTDHGHRLALASGSSNEAITEILEITGLAPFFTLALSADEVPSGKPAPDLFLLAAQRLGIPPSRCVVVEDSWPGREAARRAGMRCVFVPGNEDQLRHADERESELVFADGMAGFSPVRDGGTEPR
jgi:HAD superfamily hydrolase (TIGR01509 family)